MYYDPKEKHPPLKSERLEAFAHLLAKQASDFHLSDSLMEIARASFQGEKTVDVRLPDDQLGWWSRIEGVDLTEDALTLVVDRAGQLISEMK